MSDLLAKLYPDHLATLKQRADTALQRGQREHLVIAAGTPRYQLFDDRPYPFAVNPHFKHWLPVTKAPGSWLVYTPGQRPKLIYLQPHDYWHVVPDAPAGYWVEHFDIAIIREPAEARAHLPKDTAHCAILGEDNAALDGFAPNNPEAVLNYLHYHRAYKTDYELGMMRVASKLGARAHRAAEAAYRIGASEYDINTAYLNAVHETENELPYTNIIALNQHGAVLHYMELNRAPPAHADSFLIDAGANFHGYAADITRTYASAQAPEFQALIDAVDGAQQGFVSGVQKGKNYSELHLQAHHVLAGILKDQGFIRMSPESAVESGVSSVFYPHGLGHRPAGARRRRVSERRHRRYDPETGRSSLPASDAHDQAAHGNDDRTGHLFHRHAARGVEDKTAGARHRLGQSRALPPLRRRAHRGRRRLHRGCAGEPYARRIRAVVRRHISESQPPFGSFRQRDAHRPATTPSSESRMR